MDHSLINNNPTHTIASDREFGALKCLMRYFSAVQDNYRNRKICFINAIADASANLPDDCIIEQPLKHEYDAIKSNYSRANCPNVFAQINIEEYKDSFDMVLINAPAQIPEIKYLLAKGFFVLKEGGTLAVSAENKSGGKRLEKLVSEISSPSETQSKFKSKIVIAKKPQRSGDKIESWLSFGIPQINTNTDMYSVAGLFSHDKIDQGSAILAQIINEQSSQIKGDLADFCCGYGYLSKVLTEEIRPEKIKSITCIDTDYRAVESCKLNIKESDKVKVLWEDITDSEFIANYTNETGLLARHERRNVQQVPDERITTSSNSVSQVYKNRFDQIVMNPPFHDQGNKNIEIGVKCIISASQCLKKGGKLYMVSNRKLPYEDVLKQCFYRHDVLFEGHGYKIHRAMK